jgi:predicted phosphodiesterase
MKTDRKERVKHMKIQLLSDLHFEFHNDQGNGLVNSLKPEGVDVLILTGDIGRIHSFSTIEKIC